MVFVIFSSIAAYISTEIDDFLALFVLFSKAKSSKEKAAIVAGKYLGLYLMVVCCAYFAHYISKLPSHYVGLLGVIPLAFGIKFAVDSLRGKKEKSGFEGKETNGLSFMSLMFLTFIVTLASGGDNLALYISFFTSLSVKELIVAFIVFTVMQALLCALAWGMFSIEKIQHFVEKSEKIILPLLFVLLGFFIMLKCDTFVWLFEMLFKPAT